MPHMASLVSELRSALAHLHDPAYLENHPLARRIALVAQAPDLTRGELLRRTLRLSIEALDPGAALPANSPEARPYQILRGRYILRRTLEEVASQLDIGSRQAYRDLRRAVEALAQMLVDGGLLEVRPSGTSGSQAMPAPAARLRAELERVASVSQQDVDLGQLLTRAVENAQCLARERGKEIELCLEANGLLAAANRVMLRQAILNLLSHALHVHQGSRLPVRLSRSGAQALIRLAYRPSGEVPADSLRPGQPYAVATQLLDTVGLEWKRVEPGDGSVQLSIAIPLTHQRPVLIIDDNEGLIRLFERYLEGQPYRIFGATSYKQAQEMLEHLQPEVIILDVMMPERDGWEVLEGLRQTEAGRRARVLVCSIIDDPSLAAALGAAGFLHKPVDRSSLLRALQHLSSPFLGTPPVDGVSALTPDI